MALGQIGKPNIGLLDTLKELNDLVKSLHGKEFVEAINELKEKTNAFNEAKSQTEPLIHNLNSATRENEQSLVELKAERNALAGAKLDHDRQLVKIKAAQAAVDASKAENEAVLAAKTAEIEKRAAAVTARETKAANTHKQAEALIAEYQTKLADLKKITG